MTEQNSPPAGPRGEADAATVLRGVLGLARRLRVERPAGSVSLSGISLLGTLHRLGPLPAARLAEAEGLQAQSLTRLIATLERDGQIERQRSDVDRRALVIALTRRGEETLAAELRTRRRWLERAMAQTLSETERESLLRAAGAMLRLAGVE